MIVMEEGKGNSCPDDSRGKKKLQLAISCWLHLMKLFSIAQLGLIIIMKVLWCIPYLSSSLQLPFFVHSLLMENLDDTIVQFLQSHVFCVSA